MQSPYKIIWIALDSTLQKEAYTDLTSFKDYFFNKIPSTLLDTVDYVGSYKGLYDLQQSNETPLRNVLVVDPAYLATLVTKAANIHFLDVTLNKDSSISLLETTASFEVRLTQALQGKAEHNFELSYLDLSKEFYREVLKTYDRVTFFDHFNTFKYVVNKDIRKDLEDTVYKYFAGMISIEEFRLSLTTVEQSFKATQISKYEPVRDFIFSEKALILHRLVSEADQEVVKATLDEHSLDYFDVNYLKAFLRDYGKTKEEKTKKKVRVQDLSFQDCSTE